MTFVQVQKLSVNVYLFIRMHSLLEFWLYDVYIHTQGVPFSIAEAAPHHTVYMTVLESAQVPVLNATCCFLWFHQLCLAQYYIMAGHAIVVAKDINLLFYHGNANILTLW